ncbi:alanine/glycine:cation symporter family protein [Fundicoccus culcitae]|uniref:Sodium:alanine symporter family protein n=1 Tax=Fundicoccus culcitae TaxID=2969821 RepID=A0ABY5P6W2_9LACT|nr:sodium:alanine symporter family protein [Fundicoccus culcitae]UUX34477.1 sodium:alanine symporter family protein [Fundicoccus culcitae]
MEGIYAIVDWLWSNVIGYLLLGIGLICSIKLGFPQIKHFGQAVNVMRKSMAPNEEEGVSAFGTLMAALGGQLGTGSLVGVASALVTGGPGAIFWMWMTALFGMTISFSEIVLGQLFREKDPHGELTGGPAYYIQKGLGNRPLAVIISILYVLGIGLAIASLQTHSIANAFTGVVDIHPIVPGIIVTILAFFVIVGGMKRLTEVASLIVPVMVILYFLIVAFILVTNFQHIPAIFQMIISSAFNFRSAIGGAAGWTIVQAFRNGVARGMFSNDAGNGVVAIMHASADVKHPIQQGLLGMMGTFITTIIVCTLTALAILMTGVLETGLDGILLLQAAFKIAIGPFGSWVVFIMILSFGFTALIADIHYAEASLTNIFQENDRIPINIYRIILAILLIVGSAVQLDVIWAAVDLFVGIIILINVIAVLRLFKYVKYAYDDYFDQIKHGVEEPIWEYEKNIVT